MLRPIGRELWRLSISGMGEITRPCWRWFKYKVVDHMYVETYTFKGYVEKLEPIEIIEMPIDLNLYYRLMGRLAG